MPELPDEKKANENEAGIPKPAVQYWNEQFQDYLNGQSDAANKLMAGEWGKVEQSLTKQIEALAAELLTGQPAIPPDATLEMLQALIQAAEQTGQPVDPAIIALVEQAAAPAVPYEELQLDKKFIKTWQLDQMARYQNLLAQTEAQIKKYGDNIALPEIRRLQVDAAEAGFSQATTAMQTAASQAGLDVVNLGFNRMNTQAVEQIIGQSQGGGPLAALLSAAYPLAANGISDLLIQGTALGWNPRKTARKILADGLSPALNHILLVARDQQIRTYREASRQQYQASKFVLSYTRIAAKNNRTCMACLALDGTVYDTDTLMPLHPQDRCGMIPNVKGFSPVQFESGEAWFKRQPEETQRQMLGPGKFNLWQQGGIKFSQFASVHNHPTWGPSARVTPLYDLLKGGGGYRPPPVKPKVERAFPHFFPDLPGQPDIPQLDHEVLKEQVLHQKAPGWGDQHFNWKKQSYGGVIFDDQGRVLLRKPTDEYDGYAWTFPKGGMNHAGENPVDVALREVEEETGIDGGIIGVVPGQYQTHQDSARNNFFMMKATGFDKSKMDWETEDLTWVDYDKAKALIQKGTNKDGVKRDLQILDAATAQFGKLQAGEPVNDPLFEKKDHPVPTILTEIHPAISKEIGNQTQQVSDAPGGDPAAYQANLDIYKKHYKPIAIITYDNLLSGLVSYDDTDSKYVEAPHIWGKTPVNLKTGLINLGKISAQQGKGVKVNYDPATPHGKKLEKTAKKLGFVVGGPGQEFPAGKLYLYPDWMADWKKSPQKFGKNPLPIPTAPLPAAEATVGGPRRTKTPPPALEPLVAPPPEKAGMIVSRLHPQHGYLDQLHDKIAPLMPAAEQAGFKAAIANVKAGGKGFVYIDKNTANYLGAISYDEAGNMTGGFANEAVTKVAAYDVQAITGKVRSTEPTPVREIMADKVYTKANSGGTVTDAGYFSPQDQQGMLDRMGTEAALSPAAAAGFEAAVKNNSKGDKLIHMWDKDTSAYTGAISFTETAGKIHVTAAGFVNRSAHDLAQSQLKLMASGKEIVGLSAAKLDKTAPEPPNIHKSQISDMADWKAGLAEITYDVKTGNMPPDQQAKALTAVDKIKSGKEDGFVYWDKNEPMKGIISFQQTADKVTVTSAGFSDPVAYRFALSDVEQLALDAGKEFVIETEPLPEPPARPETVPEAKVDFFVSNEPDAAQLLQQAKAQVAASPYLAGHAGVAAHAALDASRDDVVVLIHGKDDQLLGVMTYTYGTGDSPVVPTGGGFASPAVAALAEKALQDEAGLLNTKYGFFSASELEAITATPADIAQAVLAQAQPAGLPAISPDQLADFPIAKGLKKTSSDGSLDYSDYKSGKYKGVIYFEETGDSFTVKDLDGISDKVTNLALTDLAKLADQSGKTLFVPEKFLPAALQPKITPPAAAPPAPAPPAGPTVTHFSKSYLNENSPQYYENSIPGKDNKIGAFAALAAAASGGSQSIIMQQNGKLAGVAAYNETSNGIEALVGGFANQASYEATIKELEKVAAAAGKPLTFNKVFAEGFLTDHPGALKQSGVLPEPAQKIGPDPNQALKEQLAGLPASSLDVPLTRTIKTYAAGPAKATYKTDTGNWMAEVTFSETSAEINVKTLTGLGSVKNKALIDLANYASNAGKKLVIPDNLLKAKSDGPPPVDGNQLAGLPIAKGLKKTSSDGSLDYSDYKSGKYKGVIYFEETGDSFTVKDLDGISDKVTNLALTDLAKLAEQSGKTLFVPEKFLPAAVKAPTASPAAQPPPAPTPGPKIPVLTGLTERQLAGLPLPPDVSKYHWVKEQKLGFFNVNGYDVGELQYEVKGDVITVKQMTGPPEVKNKGLVDLLKIAKDTGKTLNVPGKFLPESLRKQAGKSAPPAPKTPKPSTAATASQIDKAEKEALLKAKAHHKHIISGQKVGAFNALQAENTVVVKTYGELTAAVSYVEQKTQIKAISGGFADAPNYEAAIKELEAIAKAKGKKLKLTAGIASPGPGFTVKIRPPAVPAVIRSETLDKDDPEFKQKYNDFHSSLPGSWVVMGNVKSGKGSGLLYTKDGQPDGATLYIEQKTQIKATAGAFNSVESYDTAVKELEAIAKAKGKKLKLEKAFTDTKPQPKAVAIPPTYSRTLISAGDSAQVASLTLPTSAPALTKKGFSTAVNKISGGQKGFVYKTPTGDVKGVISYEEQDLIIKVGSAGFLDTEANLQGLADVIKVAKSAGKDFVSYAPAGPIAEQYKKWGFGINHDYGNGISFILPKADIDKWLAGPETYAKTKPTPPPPKPSSSSGSTWQPPAAKLPSQGKWKAKVSTPPQVIPPVKGLPDPPGFPPNPEKLTVVKGLGGSTGAQLVKDSTGKLYVRKRGNHKEHVTEEAHADSAYMAAGANVPAFKLYDTPGGPVKLAEFIEGEMLGDVLRKGGARAAKARTEAQKLFAVDAIFQNRDMVGEGYDNMMVDKDGKVWRIDNGGSFRYRAQGAAKDDWNDYPFDLWSLRDKKINRQTGDVFGDLTFFDLSEQIMEMAKHRDEILAAAPEGVQQTLANRIDNAISLGSTGVAMKTDHFEVDYVEDFSRTRLTIKQQGMTERMPAALGIENYEQNTTRQIFGGQVDTHRAYDEAGYKFDRLRGLDSVTAALAKFIDGNGGEYNLFRQYGSGQGMSSWSGASAALKYFIAEKMMPGQPDDNFWWNYGKDSARREYESVVALPGEEAYRKTMMTIHAFTVELLQKMDFPNKNADGTVTVMRTEAREVIRMHGMKLGDRDVHIPRAPAESGSIWGGVTVHGSEMTLMKMPLHRIFATYLGERTPERQDSVFLGDGENEFICMLGKDLPIDYAATGCRNPRTMKIGLDHPAAKARG